MWDRVGTYTELVLYLPKTNNRCPNTIVNVTERDMSYYIFFTTS